MIGPGLPAPAGERHRREYQGQEDAGGIALAMAARAPTNERACEGADVGWTPVDVSGMGP